MGSLILAAAEDPERSLRLFAEELKLAITEKDTEKLLTLVDEEIDLSGDVYRTKTDLRREFGRGTGSVFCRLFGKTCLQRLLLNDKAVSLHEILTTDVSVVVETKSYTETWFDHTRRQEVVSRMGDIWFTWDGGLEKHGWEGPVFVASFASGRWIVTGVR